MIFGGNNSSDTTTGKGKVVVMNKFRTRTTVSPLRQAEAYWSALRRGDDIPSRSQIDPRGLENILSQTFILERVAPGIARFRLAGQRVNELAGMEVRGMPLTAFFSGDSRKTVSAALESMFDKPSIVEMELQTEATRLRGSRSARLILLPLRSDLGDISRALGVLVSESGASKMSQRFIVNECDLRPIDMGAKTETKVENSGRFTAGSAARRDRRAGPADAGSNPVVNTPSVNAPSAGFSESKPAFTRKSPSLMDEARSLLDRARRENDRPAGSVSPKQSDSQLDLLRSRPAVQDSGVETGAALVSRPPRNAKTKRDASHLRLVVSRD